jgi:hypothetical protein
MKFKSYFVEYDAKVPEGVPPPKPAAQIPKTETVGSRIDTCPTILSSDYAVVGTNTGVIGGTDYTKQLQETIRSSVDKGLSYLAFVDALQPMAGWPLTDEQKMIAAFSAFKSSGYTSTQLINSANQCISILQKEDNEFEGALNQSNKEGVEGKKTEIDKLTERNKAILQEMADNNLKIQQLTTEMNTNQSKLQTEQQSFNFSLKSIKTEIENNITKIKQYLNVNTTNAS